MNETLKVVLSLTISGSLVALLLLAFKPLYKSRFRKSWQYYIYLVALLRMLLPYTPEANLIGWLTAPDANPSIQAEPVRPTLHKEEADEPRDATMGVAPKVEEGSVAEEESTGNVVKDVWADVSPYVWVVWLSVAFLLLMYKIIRYFRFSSFLLAERRELAEPEMLEWYRDVYRDMGVRQPVPVYTNWCVRTPMLVGIIRPYIVLPKAGYVKKHCRMMMRHELVHFTRHDILYKWLVQLVVCLHWFNPLVYWMRKEIFKNCELACDETVLTSLGAKEKHRYGDALLASLQKGEPCGNVAFSLSMSEDGKNIKERLESIVRYSRSPLGVRVLSYAFAVALAVGAAFLGAYTEAKPQDFDVLVRRFYEERDLKNFSAIVPQIEEGVVEELLFTTMEDDRIEYFSHIVANYAMSRDLADRMALQAVVRDKDSYFSLLIPYIGITDGLAEILYNMDNYDMFVMLVDGLSDAKREELADRSNHDLATTDYYKVLTEGY